MKRLGPVTRKQRRLVREIKALLDEHDRAETALIQAIRRHNRVDRLWRKHDHLERRILNTAARLPQPLVEMLKQGEP